MGILQDIGVLEKNKDGKVVLTEDAWLTFVDDVKKKLTTSEGVFPFKLDCMSDAPPDPYAIMMVLENPNLFPEFHTKWRDIYEKAVLPLDEKGSYGLSQALGGIPIADPTALASSLEIPPPDMDLPGVLALVTAPPPPPAVPPEITIKTQVMPILAKGGDKDIADPIKEVENIAKIKAALAEPPLPPIPEIPDPRLAELGYTDQAKYLTEVCLSPVKTQLSLQIPDTILKIPSLLGDIPKGLFDLVCSKSIENQPKSIDECTFEKAAADVLNQHMTKLHAAVFLGKNIGSGAMLRALAQTPIDQGGFGILRKPYVSPAGDIAEELMTPIRITMLFLIQKKLGPIPARGTVQLPNGIFTDDPAKTGADGARKENPLTEIMGKFTQSRVYVELKSEQKEALETAKAEEGIDHIEGMLSMVSSIKDTTPEKQIDDAVLEAGAVLSGAGDDALKNMVATQTGNAVGASIDPKASEEIMSMDRNALIKKLITNEGGRTALKEYVKDAPKRVAERVKEWEEARKKIATNCGALPGWCFFQMGCNATKDSFTVDNPYAGGKGGDGKKYGKTMTAALSSYGLTSVMLLAKSWGVWTDVSPSYSGNPYSSPLPGDVFILGIPNKNGPPTIKHIGIIIDPFFRSGYWLTADAGQGSAGINDGMKYIARKVAWGPDGIRVANASVVGKGDEWPEILGWLRLDAVAGKVFDKKSNSYRKPISDIKLLKKGEGKDPKSLANQ